MKRWSVILGCALYLSAAACSDSDGGGDGGVAGLGGSGGASGSGGSHAGHGGSGAAHAGQGGMSSSAGTSAGAGAGATGATGGMVSSGGSGGSSGASGAGGESGSGGSTGGVACGSRGLPECEDGSFCDFPEDVDCGRADGAGTCRAITDVACGEIWNPVCGCDGTTYSTSCHAYQAGMSIDHDGACGQVGVPPGYQCVSTGAMCLIAPPECPEGQVPAIEGMCFGDCVPIEACDCDGPEDCPNREMYNCHLSAGHCGPYTN
jgi:hypothetical protein